MLQGSKDLDAPLAAMAADVNNQHGASKALTALLSNLPKKERQALDRMRSLAAHQGRLAQCDRLIATLADWLLDDEQKVALAENPLNFFYLSASVYK